ncbi:CRISPR-associated ring nuclease [Azohydromonas sediminis]|uniref:CRISPR-associated ring nuclease n=1 Tax=Azohydromonas sediminis TaxID=2259674 RepID=UPI001B3555B6|nr:CRISPR-associated ring nuclease [Azohydromonas sediminis]
MSRQTSRTNVLVCTLGASWAVVPEVLGFVHPMLLPLYRDHPHADQLAQERHRHGLEAPDELWVLTTGGAQAQSSLDRLMQWWALMGQALPLRVWVAADTDQLATAAECAQLRELTLRAVLGAREHAAGGQLLLSLAGGRKTMSADLQQAGALFGAHAWLHVVGPDPLPAQLSRDPEPALFTRPLPPDLAAAVTPLVVGRGQRDDAMQIPLDGMRVDGVHFPLPLADGVLRWQAPAGARLLAVEVERRQREGGRLLGNFLAAIAREDAYPNWRSLFRLPPAVIESLRTTRVTHEHADWLRRLPKVDLHRHLGGCLDLSAQRKVAQAVWDAADPESRAKALQGVAPLLRARDGWPWEWPQALRGPSRPLLTSALLLHADDDVLNRELRNVTEPRVALKRRHPQGFSAYERPGELSGSALLAHEAAVGPYAREVVRAAVSEGLVGFELRGSPHKYAARDPVDFLRRLRGALRDAGARVEAGYDGDGGAAPGPRVGFVWILDRRQREDADAVIRAAVRAHAELEGFVVGLDLAGDEGTSRPEEWAALFAPAFRECLFVTIHAGEDEPAENIWQAAYELHADRIGHGLSLHENDRLMGRFRERGVCLELCPTSNIEVVGFSDPVRPATAGLSAYPLDKFMRAGLPVTLCTDNPGISNTTLADEYVTASRITPGGLTLWQALGLIRQGFERTFLPAADRHAILQAADREVMALVQGLHAFDGQG